MSSKPTLHGSHEVEAANEATLYHLTRVDNETLMRLSELSIPQVEELKREIANIFPAGNLPSMILSGLITLDGRTITRKRADQDINTLFQGAKLLPRGLYGVLFAGPAVVLSAYQKILTLAGKNAEEAFPEGMWQFYLQFALREDTGRHTNETIAYHRDRPLRATLVDDISAWLMTSIHTLFDTDGLTGAVWTEWTTLRLMCDAMLKSKMVDESPYAAILRAWQRSRPYRTPAGVSYADRRRMAFDMFAQKHYERLPDDLLQNLGQEIHEMAEREREPYQSQMSLLAHLTPNRYRDERVPIPLWDAKVALIWRGHYYLFDACARDSHNRPLAFTEDSQNWPLEFDSQGNPLDQNGKPLVIQGGWLYRFDTRRGAEPIAYLSPPDPAYVKGLVERITQTPRPPAMSTVDLQLVGLPRSEQSRLREMLPKDTQLAITALDRAPLIVNWDQQDRNQPLGLLRRRGQRGVGDQPITIFRTLDSMVFDQSHIFFDGTWGMALSEVLTNQAVSWCHHMVNVNPTVLETTPEPISFASSPQFEVKATEMEVQFFPISAEVSAESEAADLEMLSQTRMWLKQRGVNLTVNDLLILARLLHATDYKPSRDVAQIITTLPEKIQKQVIESLEGSRGINPALLIPMDASFVSPRERVFPVTFRNPLAGLFDTFDETMSVLKSYRVSQSNDHSYADFDVQRRELYSYLRAFGETLAAIKGIAMQGESINIATLRLLAHLPPSMQHLLNQIPQRVEVLNEIVKGEEVFSNVGKVAAESSLVRFLSAKDDGRAKRLVWGILADDQGRLHITLRDFRPHVVPLLQNGYYDLAQKLAKDYVESYSATLGNLAGHLAEISLAEDVMRWE